MKISVKILRGEECTLDVQSDVTITKLKELVEHSLDVPKMRQKLLFQGKLLLDWKTIGDYNVTEGSKLNLMIVESNPSASEAPKGLCKNILELEMRKFLRKYYNDSDTEKIVSAFMDDFNLGIKSCNLDDWEKIATDYLKQDRS